MSKLWPYYPYKCQGLQPIRMRARVIPNIGFYKSVSPPIICIKWSSLFDQWNSVFCTSVLHAGSIQCPMILLISSVNTLFFLHALLIKYSTVEQMLPGAWQWLNLLNRLQENWTEKKKTRSKRAWGLEYLKKKPSEATYI